MAERFDIFTYGGGNDEGSLVSPEILGGGSFIVQRLAAQVDKLQQVDTLTSAFSMSVDLQRSLLQQLEDLTSRHSRRQDTKAHPILTSTPAMCTLACHTNQDHQTSQQTRGQASKRTLYLAKKKSAHHTAW